MPAVTEHGEFSWKYLGGVDKVAKTLDPEWDYDTKSDYASSCFRRRFDGLACNADGLRFFALRDQLAIKRALLQAL